MMLQILPPDSFFEPKKTFDFELLFIILGLAFLVFLTIKIAKYLSNIKKIKSSNLAAFFVILFLR